MATFDSTTPEGIAMMAFGSKTCGLDRGASFEPLEPYEHHLALKLQESQSLFASHSAFRVPTNTACASQRHLGAGTFCTVHRLTVQPACAERLNRQLLQLALKMASTEQCVSKSNIGGFQSTADLFTVHGEREPLPICRELHAIVSAAVDELELVTLPTREQPLAQQTASDGSDDQAAAIRAAAQRFANATGSDRDCGDDHKEVDDGAVSLLDEARPFAWPWSSASAPPLAYPLLLHDACAWMNVNRVNDSNLIHVHHPDRWSAVWFVSNGGVEGSPAPQGHLIFRGGPRSSSRRCSCTNTYFACPPEPGMLWLFPGSIPHCVLPFGETEVEGRAEDPQHAVRVSVAINLHHAVPRVTHECELSLDERIHIADRTMPYR